MKARDGGGVLLTQAIHTLDLFLSLAGPVAELSAHHLNSGLRAIDTEDVATATLRFASGAIGSIDATSTAFPGYPERIELAGDRGAAVLETERLSVRLMDGTTIEAGSAGGGAWCRSHRGEATRERRGTSSPGVGCVHRPGSDLPPRAILHG